MIPVEPVRTLQFPSQVREAVLRVQFQADVAAKLRSLLGAVPEPRMELTFAPGTAFLTIQPTQSSNIDSLRIAIPLRGSLAQVETSEPWPVRVEPASGQWLFRASTSDGRVLVLQWLETRPPATASSASVTLEQPLPERLSALFGVSPAVVTRLLEPRPIGEALTRLTPEPTAALHVNQNRAMIVSEAIREIPKAMLIPDISPAIPRPVAPDALPATVQVRLPVADEVGLRPGQVVQALISSNGEKMALTLNQQQIPLPPGRWVEGPVQMRVVTTPQGLALQGIPEAAKQIAVTAGGNLSPVLAQTLGRVGGGPRPAIQSLFAPGGLLQSVFQLLPESSRQPLTQFQARADQLNGAVIAQLMQRNGLMLEHQLAQGVQLNGERLKPWLRQLLQSLPTNHRLYATVEAAVMDLEAIQLEGALAPQVRDGQFAALLLFTNQPPVEVRVERYEEERPEGWVSVWVIDLQTDVPRLGALWLSTRYDGQQLDLTVWADRPATAVIARNNLADLRAELGAQGLRVGDASVYPGPRPDIDRFRHPTDQHVQVDA